jgi:hypothetical protein
MRQYYSFYPGGQIETMRAKQESEETAVFVEKLLGPEQEK